MYELFLDEPFKYIQGKNKVTWYTYRCATGKSIRIESELFKQWLIYM